MRERPILFSGPMIRALLDGSKTQTRRPVKPQPSSAPTRDGFERWGLPLNPSLVLASRESFRCRGYVCFEPPGPDLSMYTRQCPFGGAGSRLWIRETHALIWPGEDAPERVEDHVVEYRADGDPARLPGEWPAESKGDPDAPRWRPSIHMPRWASRLTLDVVSVRVERLQDISESDAIAEGVEPIEDPSGAGDDCWRCYRRHCGGRDASECGGMTSARGSFETLWEATYGAESWNASPWVWVVEWAPLDAAVREQLARAGGR